MIKSLNWGGRLVRVKPMRQSVKTASNPGRSAESRVQPRAHHEDWVHKKMVIDQRKLDAARRTLGVETEAEAVDTALDLVIFRGELMRGIAAVRRVGGIRDVFERPSA
jgi:hypothetical protein